MGKVYGLHSVELKPGVSATDFEQFVVQTVHQLPRLPGWRVTVLKGDRGDQVGQYLVLVEIDSIAARDRVSPASGLTDEGQQWSAQAGPLLEQLRQYTTSVPGIDARFTDFHDIGG